MISRLYDWRLVLDRIPFDLAQGIGDKINKEIDDLVHAFNEQHKTLLRLEENLECLEGKLRWIDAKISE